MPTKLHHSHLFIMQSFKLWLVTIILVILPITAYSQTNLAPGKTITTTGSYNGNLQSMTDGIISGYGNVSFSSTSFSITIDLGAAYNISLVKIFWPEYEGSYATNYDIRISTDVNFTTYAIFGSLTSNPDGVAPDIFTNNLKGRYVRFTFNSVPSGLLIDELEIYGTEGQPLDGDVYYPFNGNANDVIGGKNGTVTGAVLTTDRLETLNNAYYFDGTNDYITIPTLTGFTPSQFSVSCWIKPKGNTAGGLQVIFDLRRQYNFSMTYNQPNLASNPNSVNFNIVSGTSNINANSGLNSILTDRWAHLTFNYGNNTMQIYVNGILADIKTVTPPTLIDNPYYYNVIGKDYRITLNRGWFYGSIDEVKICYRCLTTEEVLGLYGAKYNIAYTYDSIGNCTARNRSIITLKSARTIADTLTEDKKEVFEHSFGEQKILIYPNPTAGELQIVLKGYGNESKAEIYLYNLSGKLLFNETNFDNSAILDLSAYPAGTYILKIVLGDKVNDWKIIKE